MQWIAGDIWNFHDRGATIVIPTNAGWKHNLENVMGRGLAKDAAKKFPLLPVLYGVQCKHLYPRIHFLGERLILVPSKRLDVSKPHLSWKQPADIMTITESLKWLEDNAEAFPELVYVPILGTGNGQLEIQDIMNLMDEILKNPKFMGVLRDTAN